MAKEELDRLERSLLMHLLSHRGQQVRFEADQWTTEFGIFRAFAQEDSGTLKVALRSLEMGRYVYRRVQYVIGYSEPKLVYSLTPSGHRKAVDLNRDPSGLGPTNAAPFGDSADDAPVATQGPSRTGELIPVPVLEGPIVRLRPPRQTDLLTLFAWYNDPETVAPFDRFSVDRFEDFDAALKEAPNDPRSLAPRFVVERKEDPRILGFVGHYQAHPVLTLMDVWYVLGERAERGKGYGREAVGLLVDYLFHDLDLARVGATCDTSNEPSYRLLERLGFRREGTLRAALFHHSAWHDVAVYGITRSEWAARPRQA